ncbi:uncharacterized protein LOC141612552 [Silene latifolia]|uniref:uncharacterized protein LOC141612552 n=1 Tax=Silene latifolia TaxID=37657 RepID=UPI003D77190B
MAEIGNTLAEKLIEVVGSKAIREICSIWGYKSELHNLKDTITTIRKVLLDAESKDQLSHEAQEYIRKLKAAVYDADDLFDEYRTLAGLRQYNKDSRLSKNIRHLFSSKKNTLSIAYLMSRGVKKIRKKLHGIASNHNTFGFSVDYQTIRERREETCSYVYSDEVVGRECDLEKVVHMLLDSGSKDRVSFLSIVGVGGLGKTTLAQLVFNDERVRTEFPLRLWTCVSDENGVEFDVKTILARILESASHDKHDGFTMDLVQKKLLGFLGGKKYLIVLDDVWNEDRENWLDLRKFLMRGGGGSRVLVTTRSKRTAMVVDEEYNYELKGLSPENSWRLFEMTAFGEKGRQEANSSELIKLGEKIVEQCSNVPLAIKVVGTLLYGQNESKWRVFQECGLAKLNDGDNKIMSILKLSYDNLESPLKTCFSYCSLFPKDFRINKEKLIRLWMAQGYIVPLHVGQSLEDAGEEYLSILLRRCFFQDVEKNEFGGVQSFRIHDLIHDVAQKIAGKGIAAVNSIQTNLEDEAHHVFHIGSKCRGSIFSKCKIRSYVRVGFEVNFPVAKLVKSWNFLRTLDLHDLDIQTLPNSIGKLLHLRFLNLSDNKHLVVLPDSIRKLYNLQTLDLSGCSGLKELPKGLTKLANLRHLDISGCYELSHMPSGLDKLSCLCVLTEFVVGERSSAGILENLEALKNLRGSIRIRITEKFMGAMESREGYLRSMKHLEALAISLLSHENHATLLEILEPPFSLKGLQLDSYHEATLPSRWLGSGIVDNWATFLPNLVRIDLNMCSNLLRLPSLSKLHHLKSLSLFFLPKLEYIEDSTHDRSEGDVFFPSLETLEISLMNELKGWWRREDIGCSSCWQPSFSRLSRLEIQRCKKLTSFPACISLKKLTFCGVHKDLRIMSSDKENDSIKLRELSFDDLDYLKSLPTEGLISIGIAGNQDIENLSELGETIKGCLSLRSLAIVDCESLRSLEGAGWEHLTALDSLQLCLLPSLTDSDHDGMPWRSIGGRLRSLQLSLLDLETIPKGMRHLTSLENLAIDNCACLLALPEWIGSLSSLRSLRVRYCEKFQLVSSNLQDLTSLQFLEVRNCPLIAARFQDPDAEDWTLLRHIPSVDIRTFNPIIHLAFCFSNLLHLPSLSKLLHLKSLSLFFFAGIGHNGSYKDAFLPSLDTLGFIYEKAERIVERGRYRLQHLLATFFFPACWVENFTDSLSFSRGSEHGCYILPESNTWQGCQDRATRADVDDINSNASVLDGLNLSLHIHDSNYSGFISIMTDLERALFLILGISVLIFLLVANFQINSLIVLQGDRLWTEICRGFWWPMYRVVVRIGLDAGRRENVFDHFDDNAYFFLKQGVSSYEIDTILAITDRQFPGICYHGIDRQFSGICYRELLFHFASQPKFLHDLIGAVKAKDRQMRIRPTVLFIGSDFPPLTFNYYEIKILLQEVIWFKIEISVHFSEIHSYSNLFSTQSQPSLLCITMAEIGISIAEKLIEMVGSEAIRQIRSFRGYESELDDLKETIITIRKVLLDAESKGQLSHEAQHYIQKLQDALYDADDLFDEVRTRAELKQHNKDAKLFEKVRNFFSSTINTPSVMISMSREVKKLRKKLDGIANNHNKFGFSVDSQPIRERREDTCSYAYSDEVIVGREGDLNEVVHMLLDSSSQDRVSFLSIVGIGGLGKTKLAQLVFNDDRVTAEFPIRLWTCVSDENKEEFKVKKILTKILESASDNKLDGLTMDLVHRKLLGFLGGRKYLIVLDDVWNEDLEKWLSLKEFLMSGGGGSRVLVTTRSERTAMVIDEEHKYELKGLSPENSWRLFEMTAFREKEKQDVNYAELITLGKRIVEQCSNVPLAIKVVGTLLYGQNERKWRLFKECGLAKLKDGDNKIMTILKLSYDNLESPLKTCFTYCALFPKDFRINKEKLIRLWMAQGYIVPFDIGQSLEDAGEEYISILLRRCFFQDVEKNDIQGVESFKIHDLIHDVAQKVAGTGFVAVTSIQTNFGNEAHHLFHIGSKRKGSIFSKCKIRSYVRDGFEFNFQVAELVKNWKFLRTLDLHDLDIKALPNSIGKLLHLRYLDLSYNSRLLVLPDSVTKLYNLQTLDLRYCSSLQELPKGLAKLANLRHLDLAGCFKLSHMPSGLDKLSCLCVLTNFVVGEESSIVELENLLALKNLRGSFQIRINHEFLCTVKCKGGYLRSMDHLEALKIWMKGDGNHETLLEKLAPPPSLKQLNLSVSIGATLPSSWWGAGKVGNWATYLPNLVNCRLYHCPNVLHLPSLSRLPHLQSLSLEYLDKLEYIEDFTHIGGSKEVFFPSLEELEISCLGELRGWWRGEDIDWNNHVQPCFSRLSKLNIALCKKLTSFPACISLEMLNLYDVNKELSITNFGQQDDWTKLREVQVDNLDYLKALTTEGLTSIFIHGNDEIESLSQLVETFRGFRSLRSLAITMCGRLRSLDGVGWEHLTALDSLRLKYLPVLTFSGTKVEDDDDDGDGMPWRSIGGKLRSLELLELNFQTIPKGIRHLTSLENLTIEWIWTLISLPEWISCLSSLRSLRIRFCLNLQLNVGILRDLTTLQLLEVKGCPLVTERFQNPDGEDWAELRHIPSIDIRSGDDTLPVEFHL